MQISSQFTLFEIVQALRRGDKLSSSLEKKEIVKGTWGRFLLCILKSLGFCKAYKIDKVAQAIFQKIPTDSSSITTKRVLLSILDQKLIKSPKVETSTFKTLQSLKASFLPKTPTSSYKRQSARKLEF